MYRLPTREQNLCACAGLQTANPPQHFDHLEASTAASFARLGLSCSLRSPYDGTPALHDLAAIGAPNQLAGQVARMNLEEARSEADSYSDAESSASSTRRKSAAFSDLSSIRKSRRADKSTSAIRNHHTLHGARRRDIVKRQAGSSTKADESINYVAKVKKTFGDKPGTYLAFLEILHTYQKEQKSIKDVYEEVSRLFKDHTELLAEFSQFLPYGQPLSGPGLEATPPPVPPPQAGSFAAQNTTKAPIEFDTAISYVTKVRKTFGDKPGTYRAFLETLHTYEKEQKSIKDVYEEVSRLFKDHTELLAEFSQFLPDGCLEG